MSEENELLNTARDHVHNWDASCHPDLEDFVNNNPDVLEGYVALVIEREREPLQATIAQQEKDIKAIRAKAADAIEFYDKVCSATTEEQISVGADHIKWVLSAIREIAKHPEPSAAEVI